MSKTILEITVLFIYLSVAFAGWEFASLIKENQKLKAKVSDINTFCVDKSDKFDCNIQILPDGRKIIYVSEKK